MWFYTHMYASFQLLVQKTLHIQYTTVVYITLCNCIYQTYRYTYLYCKLVVDIL